MMIRKAPNTARATGTNWSLLIVSKDSDLKSVEDAAVELVNRLPELSDEAKLTMMELRRTLHSADELAVGLHAEDGSFNRALVRLGNASARVAHLAQRAGRIAKREILVSVAPFPNCWPQQPKKGADLFATLAGLVNCLITWPIRRLGHLL